MADQDTANAEAYHAGRDAYLNDPENGLDRNPFHPLSAMHDHFIRGFEEEMQKTFK